MPRPSIEYAEKKRKEAAGLANYSYLLILISLGLDAVAIQIGEVALLLAAGIAVMIAWWIAMSSVNKLNKMIEKQTLLKL